MMVYAALNTNLVTVSLLAVLGGLWFDALSANPLGVTILPLFAVGFPICLQRDLILRELPFAQIVLGAAASAVVPVLTRFAVADRRPGAVARLGFALAMACDDGGRRGGDAGYFCRCSTGAITRSATSRGPKPVSVPTAKSGGENYESQFPVHSLPSKRRVAGEDVTVDSDCGLWTVRHAHF